MVYLKFTSNLIVLNYIIKRWLFPLWKYYITTNLTDLLKNILIRNFLKTKIYNDNVTAWANKLFNDVIINKSQDNTGLDFRNSLKQTSSVVCQQQNVSLI